MIVEDVKQVINELVDTEGFPPINVELMENELGILYMNSKKGEVCLYNAYSLLNLCIIIMNYPKLIKAMIFIVKYFNNCRLTSGIIPLY